MNIRLINSKKGFGNDVVNYVENYMKKEVGEYI